MMILAAPIKPSPRKTNRKRRFITGTFLNTFQLRLSILLLTSFAGMSAAAMENDRYTQLNVEQSSAIVPAKDQISTSKLAAMVTKPMTWIDVLKNLKFAVDHGLIERTDFYTDDNLKHFLGGLRVIRSKQHPNYYDVCDLTATIGESKRVCIRIFTSTKDETDFDMTLGVVAKEPFPLTAEIVQDVFGLPTDLPTTNPTSGMDGSPTIPSLPAPIRPLKNQEATNTDLEYVFKVPPHILIARFITNAQGEIVHFEILVPMEN